MRAVTDNPPFTSEKVHGKKKKKRKCTAVESLSNQPLSTQLSDLSWSAMLGVNSETVVIFQFRAPSPTKLSTSTAHVIPFKN